MPAYFLIRDGVRYNVAIHAAVTREDRPEIARWLARYEDVQFCRVDDKEFERARLCPGAIVLSSEFAEVKEVAIAFGPGEDREEFFQFRDLIEDDLRREKERTNITEEIWLNCDTRPLDLANFHLPRVSNQMLRRFAVGCCDLVADTMHDERSQYAVETARRAASGLASEAELQVALDRALEVVWGFIPKGQGTPEYGAACLALNAVEPFDRTPTDDAPDGWTSQSAGGSTSDCIIRNTIQASGRAPTIDAEITRLLRAVCGNPFQKPAT